MTNRAGMTARQAELLAFIRTYNQEHGFTPSYDEMAEHMTIASRSGIHRLIIQLEGRGHIRRRFGRSRSIEIIESLDRMALAVRLALVARNTITLAVTEARPVRPGELEAALLAVLP